MSRQPEQSPGDRLDHEQLVAYLDGELSPDEAARLEQRLATDETARRELEELDRSWDLLDQLPAVETARDFTRNTLELIAHRVQQETTTTDSGHWLGYVLRGLAVIAGFATGYVVLSLVWPDANAQLLEDLPIVENLQVLEQVESLDFLRQLQAADMPWHTPTETAPSPNENEPVASEAPPIVGPLDTMSTPPTLAERRARIATLDGETRQRLDRRWASFTALPIARQAELRALYLDIVRDAEAEALLATMVEYRAWLEVAGAARRAEFLALPGPERITAIHEQLTARLNAADLAQLRAWVDQGVLETLPAQRRRELEQMPESRRRYEVRAQLRHRPRAEDLQASYSDARWEELLQALSPAAAQRAATATTVEARHRLIWEWFMTAVRQEGRDPFRRDLPDRPDPRDVSHYFREHISAEERNELLQLPPEQLREELVERYQRWQGRRRGPMRDGGPGRDGPPREGSPMREGDTVREGGSPPGGFSPGEFRPDGFRPPGEGSVPRATEPENY